jgi:endonuclease YncB( thermonuclease family)
MKNPIYSLKKALSGAFFISALLLVCSCEQSDSQYSNSEKYRSELPNSIIPKTSRALTSCPNFDQIDKQAFRISQVDWLPDGDTIHLKNGDKLRLLHINTPEIKPKKWSKANKPEAYAKEAKQHLEKLIGSSNKIYWLLDKQQKDKFGRYLALVFNHEGTFINADLIKNGFARKLIMPPNQRYWECFHQLEKQARENKQGLWGLKTSVAISSKQVKADQGFQWLTGKITEIDDTKKYRWIVLDNQLWVGIPRENMNYFNSSHLNQFKQGKQLSLFGFVYESYGKLRVKLNHPGMLIE